MNQTILTLAYVLFLTIEVVLGQSSFYYKELGIREGLTQSKVTSILTDNRGYLWIGTENGLNRYDRDKLKPYLHKKNDNRTLPGNRILFVAEDSLLNLWVATEKGLALYDRSNDNFKPVLVDGDRPLQVVSSLLTADGILFGGSGVIFRFLYATQKLEVLYEVKNPALYNPFRHIIKYDKDHVLINSNWHGLFLFNLSTKEFNKLEAFQGDNYTAIFLDSKGRFWVSLYGGGVYCYQGETLLRHFTTDNSPLTYNVIYDMLEKDGELWLATDGGGVNVISLDDFFFKSIRNVQDDPRSFPTNSLYRLYLDPSNNIWVGSVRRGLLGVKRVHSSSFRRVPFGDLYGLSNETVNSFFQDKSGKVWIGTDGGGLNRFDPKTSTFAHFPIVQYDKIVSIVDYSPNELLFFSFNKGLFVFDKKTGMKRPFTLVNKDVNDQNCKKGFTVNIAQYGEDKLIFGGQQIIIYDKGSHSFDIVATRGEDYVSNSPIIVSTDKQKVYFADVENIGEYDFQKKTYKTIYKGTNKINDAETSGNGLMWLATNDGLGYYDLKRGEFSLIETTLFQEAKSVLVDMHNRVWVGTSDRLYLYDISTNNFIMLDEVDGVSPNEYLSQSTLLTDNGDILVGGTIGMTMIGADISFNTAKAGYKIELLDALLDGLPVVLGDKQEKRGRTIEVPWDFSSIQLKVLLNEEDVFRSNIFRFRVEGFDDGLVHQHVNSLFVNHLPEGSYNITASYYTRTGEWSEEQQLLTVVVAPPWWRTSWFLLGMYVLCACLIVGVFYYYDRKKKILQGEEIAKLKNRIAEEKVNFLTNISHELRTPLTLIYSPLKRIVEHKVDETDKERQLGLVFQHVQQMKNIINMVLDIRKIEDSKDMLNIEPCQFNEWLGSTVDKFGLEFENKHIDIAIELDEAIGQVPMDKNKCDFVLANFLMNALKFSDKGSRVSVSSKMLEADGMVEVMVKDEGEGLGATQADLLFSKFYQGMHEKGGSGIGLYYAKELIQRHKGQIGAINNMDKGATFYFRLPLVSDRKMDLPQSMPEYTEEQVSKPIVGDIDYAVLKTSSILIVEDTLDLREYLKKTLNQYFHKVYVAKNGEEALSMIKSRLPDVIVSDVMMSSMNGFELCRIVKTDLDISHIPFLLVTAYSSPQNMHMGYKTGADAFLPKPFDIEDLLIMIHNQLILRQNIRERYRQDGKLTHHETSFSNADETFLIKLNTVITENMVNQKLNVEFLASKMNVSRSLLFNKVKAITGMGIVDYVNRQRIEHSVVLLTTTSLNINEITEEVGFSSTRYFSTVFKSLKGDTPSAYRKEHTVK